MPARVRWQGKTADRGYGHTHQAERERRLLAYRPGDICAHGGEPMLWWPLAYARRFLDLPHTTDRTGYLPGLSCRRHNRADGAIRGNRMRGQIRAWRKARQWLWQVPAKRRRQSWRSLWVTARGTATLECQHHERH